MKLLTSPTIPTAAAALAMCAIALSLPRNISPLPSIYMPGSAEFRGATERWSALCEPATNAAVIPRTALDVARAVSSANERGIPFLAYSSGHGAVKTLARMRGGISIDLGRLDTVDVAADGRTARIGGGAKSKKVIDVLAAAGKQTVTGACECVGFTGPALGGGHGWLQGRYGLAADQIVSMDVVLADGSLRTIYQGSGLMWAMKGAGHNFGIVTSVVANIYDVAEHDWAVEVFVFTGDKVEAIYEAANGLGADGSPIVHWSYWLNDAAVDPLKPVVVFYLIQEGVRSIDIQDSHAFARIGPVSVRRSHGNYSDLARWTGVDEDSPPCQKSGLANPRFPIYLDVFDASAMREAYDVFAAAVSRPSPLAASIFMFEAYRTEGVRAVDANSTAFPFRHANILAAPLMTYARAGREDDDLAADVGNRLRWILHRSSGLDEVRAYVNYAYGDESTQQLYGNERWRQDRLLRLKEEYDPAGRFGFYAPIGEMAARREVTEESSC